MLLKLSDKISECLTEAAEARERAKAATDPGHKADFLDMELRWLRLVEATDLSNRHPDFWRTVTLRE